MPIEVPEVRVVDDPIVVFAMVGLFAAAALLALYFATPWASRLPRPTSVVADETPAEALAAQPLPAPGEPPAPPADDQPRPAGKVPWSTTAPDADPPWHARPGARKVDD